MNNLLLFYIYVYLGFIDRNINVVVLPVEVYPVVAGVLVAPLVHGIVEVDRRDALQVLPAVQVHGNLRSTKLQIIYQAERGRSYIYSYNCNQKDW